MRPPLSLRIDGPLFRRLMGHLFPGDGDEHGAVIAAGIATSNRGTRLLAREVFLAQDGVDYVPGQRGYRALTPRFVAQVSDYCAEQGLCYLAVHCHGGTDSVAFSSDDMASHERGYPALLDICDGPVGALVFAANAVAGDIWAPQGRSLLSHLTVVGTGVRTLCPSPPARPPHAGPVYDRHARLFGDIGQAILGRLKVGIIGLGGGGSLVNEWLARLGVGHIVAVDFDKVTPSNLPRIVGATWWDAATFFARRKSPWLQRLGWRLAKYKVHVARRVAIQANPSIRYDAVVGDVLDEATAKLLTDADFLVLASDSIQSRLVFNALVQQYLIPGAQVGAKVTVNKETCGVEDVFTATRPVLPGPASGCLHCHQLISPSRLQEEALTERERRAQRYVDDDEVAEPSVITLNVLSAGQAVNDLMMMFTGLYREQAYLGHQLNFVRDRCLSTIEPMVDDLCLDCGDGPKSRRARGDKARLPCRMAK
jgi:molybdopterin/thiamine biosynthesis adenylyltransferase